MSTLNRDKASLDQVESYQREQQKIKNIAVASIVTLDISNDILEWMILPQIMEQIKYISYCYTTLNSYRNNEEFCRLSSIANFTVFNNYLKFEDGHKAIQARLNYQCRLDWVELRMDIQDNYGIKLINYASLCDIIQAKITF